MIWALIISGLVALFGGGEIVEEAYFTEMKQNVREIVEDGGRRREAVSLAEDLRKLVVKAQKLKRRGNGDLFKIIYEGEDPRTYTSDVLLSAEKLGEYREEFLEARLELAEVLTPEEWAELVEASRTG